MDSERTERLVIIAGMMILVGLYLPAYAKLTAALTGRGVQLAWFHHLVLLLLTALLALLCLLLIGLLLAGIVWIVDAISRVIRGMPKGRE